MQQVTRQLFSIVALTVVLVTSMHDATAQKTVSNTSDAGANPLQVKLVRSKVVLESGQEVMQSAAVAKPGEIIEDVATYINTTKFALKNVEATLPVPTNTELVMASVKPATAKASIDGKNFSKIPLTRKVRQPNGVEVEQPVPLSEYRYLRWYPGELLPDKPLSFSARFKVADSQVVTGNAAK